MATGFEYLDMEAIFAARDAQHEATTTANSGPYTVPLGGMLRREQPAGYREYPPCDGNGFCNLDDWSSQLYGQDPQAKRMY
jgi:hypothetical protein